MDRKWIGIILVVIGGVFLLGNLGVYRGEYTLLIIGILFLLAYRGSGDRVENRNIGLLIPGSIVSMIGIFAIIDQNRPLGMDGGYLFFIMLGTAFIIVYLLHTRRLLHMSKGKRQWPLYPGISLYGFSLFIFLIQTWDSPTSRFIMENLFPVGLIVAGIIILGKNIYKKRT